MAYAKINVLINQLIEVSNYIHISSFSPSEETKDDMKDESDAEKRQAYLSEIFDKYYLYVSGKE